MQIPTTRKYPKTVTIGDETYKIKFVRKVPGEDGQTMGLCDTENLTIYIKMGQPHAETYATFIHEVIHAMEEEYDIEISHPAVYKLERAISDFILTNF